MAPVRWGAQIFAVLVRETFFAPPASWSVQMFAHFVLRRLLNFQNLRRRHDQKRFLFAMEVFGG